MLLTGPKSIASKKPPPKRGPRIVLPGGWVISLKESLPGDDGNSNEVISLRLNDGVRTK